MAFWGSGDRQAVSVRRATRVAPPPRRRALRSPIFALTPITPILTSPEHGLAWRGGQQGKADAEAGAARLRKRRRCSVGQLHRPALVLHEAPGHGEAEAGSVLLARGDEGVEERGPDGGRDPRPLVGQPQDESVLTRARLF